MRLAALRAVATASAMATAVLASGCSILPDPAPPAIIYKLSLADAAVEPDAGAMVVRVDRPSAITIYNSRKIVVSPDGRRLSTLAQAQWPEGTPTLIQSALVEAFASEPAIVAVLPQSGVRTDTRIHMTVNSFEARFDRGEEGAPLALVDYALTMTDATNRRLIDTFAVRREVRADAARVSSIVAALDRANGEAMEAVVDWVVSVDRRGLVENAVRLPDTSANATP